MAAVQTKFFEEFCQNFPKKPGAQITGGMTC